MNKKKDIDNDELLGCEKLKKKKLSKGEKWKICETCGDYEYCAGNYGTDKCTGYIPGNNTYDE